MKTSISRTVISLRSRLLPLSPIVSILAMIMVCFQDSALAQAPDLTNGATRTDDFSWNLGPTGMAGWFYRENWSTKYGGWDTDPARQIEVTQVDAGSPADGVLVVGDVILGADGTGAQPVAFTSDARKAFAYAIADAEANTPATLKLLVWRAGTTSTMTVTLETLGSYSATAPYNCPKSAAVLERGLDAIMAGGGTDSWRFSLVTLLAGNDPSNPDNAARMARAQQEAHDLILTQEQIDLYTSDTALTGGKIAWEIGFKLVAIAEYYLMTGDSAVYDSLHAYATAYANGQSMFGTSGHQFSLQGEDGSLNGPYGKGYGVVNSANMQCFYGLLLAREAGLTDQKFQDAIDRASRFYGSYVDRGGIPYGEHSPGKDHGENGKNGIAALCFKMEGMRNDDANYFSKMAGESVYNLDAGHQGPYLNYLWAPLGANAGGEESMATFFAETSWRLDLARNWDGSFTYNSYQNGGQYGYGGSTWSGRQFQISMACLLPYATPLRQTYMTGKGNIDQSEWLTSAEVAAVENSTAYDAVNRTTAELLLDLASWSPFMRLDVAKEIGSRTSDHASLIPTLHGMATDTNAPLYSRMGACAALGEIKDSVSVPLLVGLLSDSEDLVQWAAANALPGFSGVSKLAEVDAIMAACIAADKPLLPLDEEDPIHITHAAIAALLFDSKAGGILRTHDLVGIDRDLLYPTIRSVVSSPRGAVRGTISNVYANLSRADVEALADAIVPGSYTEAPADRMFAAEIRTTGLDLLQLHNFAEGVPLSQKVFTDLVVWQANHTDSLSTLENYAGSSTLVEPDPRVEDFCEVLIATGIQPAEAQAIMDAIAGDTSPTAPTPLKRINYIYPDASSLTLPADRTILRAETHDYVQGDSVYTWRKVHGAGEVNFFPNGTASANTTNVTFDGTPGEYLLELKMSDSLGLTEVTKTIAYTLFDAGGNLPANGPPTADSQAVSAIQGTPTPIVLTGSDPEGHALAYSVTGQPANGTLTGMVPSLLYTPSADFAGADSVSFEVLDSAGQISSATVSITVNAPTSPIGLAIYEPFDYPIGAINGVSGPSEVGLDGSWSSSSQIEVGDSTMAYGTLLSNGLRLTDTPNGASRPINAGALANRGLLDDGSTLWFSVMMGNVSTAWTKYIQLALGNSGFANRNYITDDGGDLGTGLGITMDGNIVRASQFHDSSQGAANGDPLYGDWDQGVAGKILGGGQRLIVGKISWGANSDTIEVFLPLEDMVLPSAPSSSLVADVDQSKFDVLTFSRGGDVMMDEIRFGATLQSVLQGTVEMSEDLSAPEPDPMSFVVSPIAANPDSITMTAATAYDALGVDYYFTCTAGGGNDSGWQESSVYTDTGLSSGVEYSYTVKARDKYPSLNETVASAVQSATIPSSGVVPNVLELPQATAELLIQNSGMAVGTVTQSSSYSMTVQAGLVMGQTPPAASPALYGASVDLIVSIGQDPMLPAILAASIEDDTRLLPVYNGEVITYTLTFSEAMDLSSIQANDFVTLGSSPVTIGTIAQVSPEVVTVEVTPSGVNAGTIRLAIGQGADVRDAEGAALNTTTAIVDDTTISVNAGTKPNSAPFFPLDPILVADANEGAAYTDSIAGSARDDDEDGLSFTKTGGPAWLSIAGDGSLSGLPGNGDVGLNAFTVSVNDGSGGSDTASLNVTVVPIPDVIFPTPDPMTWSIVPAAANAGVTGSMTVSTTVPAIDGMDIANDGTTIGGRSLWSDAPVTGQSFVTGAGGGALRSLTAVMSGGVAYKTYVVRVGTLSGSTFTEIYSETFNQFFDLGSNEYVTWEFSAPVNLAANTQYGVDVGLISSQEGWQLGIPKLRNTGELYAGGSSYQSGAGGVGSDSVSYRSNEDLAFHLDIAAGVPVVVDALSMTATTASDESGVEYYFTEISGNPGGSDSGWQDSPFYTDSGLELSTQYTYTVMVRDKSANQNTTAPSIAASATTGGTGQNIPPVWLSDPLTETDATEDDPYSSSLADNVSDANGGDVLIFVKVAGPPWLSVASDGSLSGTPTSGDIGGNAFTISVTDGNSVPVNAGLNITVTHANDAPIFTVDPIVAAGATEDAAYSGTIAGSATDADGDPLTYAKVIGPAWLSVAGDGSLSGIPSNGDVGGNGFTVSVSDGVAPAVSAILNIEVTSAPLGDLVAPNPDPMSFAILPTATGVGGGSGTSSISKATGSPPIDGFDQANLAASMGSYSIWGDRPAAGQTFTTGVDAVMLGGLTIPVNNNSTATKTYTVRVGTVSGTNFTEIHSESFTQTFDLSTNDFVTWSFASSVSLNPNTLYGIDVALASSTSGWSSGIPALRKTADNYAGGSSYASGSSGAGTGEITLYSSSDMAFHLNLETPGGPSEDTITMTATAALDPSGVEYYFAETSGNPGGDDSGWQDSPDFTDTGLQAGTQYIYTVTARDKSANQNETAPSAVATAITAGTPPNVAPFWTSSPVDEADASEDLAYTSTLADDAADGNAGDALSFAKVSGPAWLNVANDGALSGTPDNGDVGANTFVVSVSDGIATAVEATLNVWVSNTNDDPIFVVDPITFVDAAEDSVYAATIAASATDDDADALLTFAKVSGPGWLAVDSDGLVSGIPGNADVGVGVFTVSVSDGISPPVNATLNITVNNTNDTPVFAANPIAVADATEDAAYVGTIAGSAFDEDVGASLSFAKVDGPAWLAVANNGVLFGTPDNSDVGVNGFTVSVSDGIASPVEATLNITVLNTNDEPAFTVDPIDGVDATEDAAYNGTIAGIASDEDAGDALTYTKAGGPAWLSVASDGALSGTPDNDDVGASIFTVSVTDGNSAAVQAILNITVINTNDDPVFTVDPIAGADATEDAAYVETIAGSSTDDDTGDTLIYAKVSGPVWLIVAGDGTLSGTPASGDVGANAFTVSVTDGNSAAVSAALSITVNAAADTTAPNPDPLTWAAVPAPASGSGSGVMSRSVIAPVVDGADLSSSGAVVGGVLVWTDRPAIGQAFTTGLETASLRRLTSMLSNGLAGKTYLVRVGTLSGTAFTEIHSETFTQPFDIGTNDYVTWEFSAPVSLEANTQYGIDVGLTSSSAGWSSGMPSFRRSADLYAGGSRYSSGSGAGGSSVTYFSNEDTIFHLDLSTGGGSSEDAISMTATDATDDSGVEYFFAETSGNPGGSDSGWQDSSSYTDTGLQAGTEYTYTVMARDKSANQNTTAPSVAASATTAGTAPNAAPVWVSNPLNEIDAFEGSAYSSSLADDGSDADAGNTLSFSKVSGPAWLSVASDGILSGTPGNSDIGANAFTVSVSDGIAPPVEATLNITVVAVLVVVPDIVAFDQSSAEAAIVAASLMVGAITQEYSATVPAGDVISQGLAGGSSVSIGSVVDLVISLGVDLSPKLVRTTVSSVSSAGWTTVSLGKTYNSPVIIATPIYPQGEMIPVATRITNVTSTGFDLKMDRADGLTGEVNFDVSVLVVDEGVYTQGVDGVTMEAVKFNSTITSRKNSWTGEARSYQNSYTSPVVFGQVMSANDPDWSVFWCMGSSRTSPPSATSLALGKHVGEDSVTTRADESIGYIVIESGSGMLEGVAYEAGLGGDTVRGLTNSSVPFTYSLNGALSSVSAAAVTQAAMDGGDGSWAVLGAPNPFSPTSVGVYVAEDVIGDSEQAHTTEQVGYIIFE